MNKIVYRLENALNWDIVHFKYANSEADTLEELFSSDNYWKDYTPPKNFYKSKMWFRGKIDVDHSSIDFSEGIDLKFVVDDSAYLWLGKIKKLFFPYEKTIRINYDDILKNRDFYLLVFKTAGLVRIIDVQVTPIKIKKEIEKIREFTLGLKSIYKLLSFDTEQSNARKRIDPNIDKTKLDENERTRLKQKLDELITPFEPIIENKDYKKILDLINSLQPKLKSIIKFTRKFNLTFASNAHIDAAWLWRKKETKEVCKTTFTAVDIMMNKRKDFTYTQSSAVFYKWVEDEKPQLFKKIKKRVKQGRWEIIGGTWLEPDCNLISGESWIEQILFGKNYFKDKFGIDEKIAFNPDSFGYNANLPMIYNDAGITTFFTQKIGWNEETVFPHRIFLWESKDGSRILSYFPFDYVDLITDPFKFVDWLRQFEANTGSRNLLILFGIGDHGGGPTPEMFEKIDTLKKIPGFPNIKFDSVKNYLSETKKELNESELPVWKDELYLEFHQGTFTTQAELKRWNRQLELQLSNLEKLQSLAEITSREKFQTTTDLWEPVLFNQFHDILPGSSIREVVVDAIEDYKECYEKSKLRIQKTAETLFKTSHHQNGRYITVFNPFNWTIEKVIELNAAENLSGVLDVSTKRKLKIQKNLSEEEKKIFVAKDLPPFCTKTFELVFDKKEMITESKRKKIRNNSIENRYFKITFDPDRGILKKVFDKKNKRIVSEHGLNQLVLIDDKPDEWDAWNIDLNGENHYLKFEKFELVEDGPVRTIIRFYYSFFHPKRTKSYPTKDFPTSFFEQDVILYRNLNQIDFETRVDWWEDRMLLKTNFPIKVKNPKVNYEIPFGFIERNHPGKTEVEKAKTEVPALKWVELHDKNLSAAIINNSKHGFDFKDGVLRMSLLRSPLWPDPTADRRKHQIKYSLITRPSQKDKTELFKKAYVYNSELPKFRHNRMIKNRKPFLKISPENVILSSIKAVKGKENSYTFHFFETKGKESMVKLELPRQPGSVYYSNIMQEELERITAKNKTLSFNIKGYSIGAVRVNY